MVAEVALGRVTSGVTTQDPSHSGDAEFIYIDIAAVDQETKAITAARRVPTGEAPSRARQIVQAGDVLVSTVRPKLNAVAQVDQGLDGATASTGFTVLRPAEDLDGRYLFHWVRSPRFIADMVRKSTGASYPAVSDRIIAGSAIRLPSIEEQRRIADILDCADALRVKRREALVLLDDLTQSIFRDMFGNEDWPRTHLRLLATKITKGTTPTSVGLTFEESGVPFLRVMDLVGGLAIPSSRTLHISEASHKVLARSGISGGEVLISIAGTIGRIATVPAGLPEMNCNQAVAIVALGSQVDLNYLAAWLRGPDAGRQMGSGSVTATIANLSLKEVGDLLVPNPPRELQRTFADRASMVRHNRLTCESLVAGQNALFTSLQQRAFAGQL